MSGNNFSRILPGIMAFLITFMQLALSVSPAQAAEKTELFGPAGSEMFGTGVTVLPNGNLVVTDPGFDLNQAQDVGAVYLYHGATLRLISALTGSTSGDTVSGAGITVLANGNYLVRSTNWSGGAGAVTWCSALTGCSGVVSPVNSLVGSRAGDRVGRDGILSLPNGNYVVQSPAWANGALTNAGAVTFCNGITGCTGEVSPSNSLVGSHANDQVGFYPDRVVALTDENYVVPSPYWTNGAVSQAGAVTWCSGTTGCVGSISSDNSLVGTQAGDEVGGDGVVPLPGGKYVVLSPKWANSMSNAAGAVTFCDHPMACNGPVTATNSLVGSSTGDQVGLFGVTVLKSGDYVVNSQWWANGANKEAGAVTWCKMPVGCHGPVSAANSLVGRRVYDHVGYGGIAELANGNFVVSSLDWANDTVVKAGAVTLCSSALSCIGEVSVDNSLVGSKPFDQVGFNGVVSLSNGHYVVGSMYWDLGVVSDVGAVTWCDGSAGCQGPVTSVNSLVGSQTGDQVGSSGSYALKNGNYVVNSATWANGPAAQAGASTWCDGTVGCAGPVTAVNSLVGSHVGDHAGYSTRILTNGNYIVAGPDWTNGTAVEAGFVTWCNGAIGCRGVVSPANSLVGSQAGDKVGVFTTGLENGHYLVSSIFWANGPVKQAGAVTWCDGMSGCSGPVTAGNSLVGSQVEDMVGAGWPAAWVFKDDIIAIHSPTWDRGETKDSGAVTYGYGTSFTTVGPITPENSVLGISVSSGLWMNISYNELHGYLVVGQPKDNMVTIIRLVWHNHLPHIFR